MRVLRNESHMQADQKLEVQNYVEFISIISYLFQQRAEKGYSAHYINTC